MEALEALEEMKPAINATYTAYMDKLEETKKAEREASIIQQTNQWQQSSPKSPSSEWSLQDALRGVAGVGINDEQKLNNATNYHQQTNYPTYLLHNQSDGYAYHAQGPPDLPPKPPSLPPKVQQQQQQPVLPPKIPLDKAPELPPKIKLEEHRTGVTTDGII